MYSFSMCTQKAPTIFPQKRKGFTSEVVEATWKEPENVSGGRQPSSQDALELLRDLQETSLQSRGGSINAQGHVSRPSFSSRPFSELALQRKSDHLLVPLLNLDL